ncbi:hypothetical protein NDU88_005945 [Pleurodeles waltl]|uniref:Uncharacterized protein n=1 Tax=Pleurodeles waltl TaxID=8319 RepID=A0AAV7TYN2_PLEWA|nr:hypothetical protein NDU88_005945 [Pleurodeles waltl]
MDRPGRRSTGYLRTEVARIAGVCKAGCRAAAAENSPHCTAPPSTTTSFKLRPQEARKSITGTSHWNQFAVDARSRDGFFLIVCGGSGRSFCSSPEC